MKLSIVLYFACISLASCQSSIKVDYTMMKDIVVSLCSRFCETQKTECGSSIAEPAIYAPLNEMKGNKSYGINVEVTVHGDATLVTGHKGKGIHLPNTGTYDDNYLDLGRFYDRCLNNVDKCDSGYTVSFWYNEDNGNHRWPVLASASDWQIWTTDSPKGNAPYFSWFKRDGFRYIGGGTANVTNEEWHHVALVARSRTDVSFYVDGEMIADGMRNDRVEGINQKNIEFGCYERANCIAASFDEIKIWEEALTDDDIKDIFRGK